MTDWSWLRIAGGGTVDLITYEVVKIRPYLELKELVPGTGGMAGSMGLNKRFEDTVRQVVGDEQFVNLKKTVGWAKAVNEFDKSIKTAFDGDVTDIHYINFPKSELEDDPAERLFNNCWEMTGDVLQGLLCPFRPCRFYVGNLNQDFFQSTKWFYQRHSDNTMQTSLTPSRKTSSGWSTLR